MPERWAKKKKDGQKMGTKKISPFFLKKMGNAKKKGGQKMGHQIGKDEISLESKMNVLKSMVPSREAAAGPGLPVTFELNVFISCWPFSSSVYISQLIKYPTVSCPPASTPHP